MDNLRVTSTALGNFRPLGISRVGYDATVELGSRVEETYPPFTMLLPTSAQHFQQLALLWSQTLAGSPAAVNFTITLEGRAVNGNTDDMVTIRFDDAFVVGFSDGTLTPPSLRIQPTSFTVVGTLPSNNFYASVALPVMTSPVIDFKGGQEIAAEMLGSYRFSGEETIATVNPNTGQVHLSQSSFAMTLVAKLAFSGPGIPTTAVREFDGLERFFGDLRHRGETVTLTLRPYTLDHLGRPVAGSTTTVEHCVVTKLTMISPYLIQQNDGVAPYVYDMVLKRLGQFQQ